jgi:hypothetical protein
MIVYGTEISADICFPLILPVETEKKYHVELLSQPPSSIQCAITSGFMLYYAHGRNVFLYSDREFDGSEEGQPWCYEVQDVIKFYWVGAERKVYYEMGEKGDEKLLAFWFIHLLLPLYMTLEQMYDFLHAGAVEIDGKPILFIAPSMGGKSTMTDYFIKKGHRLISDDKVPTFIDDGKFMAVGSHPYHRPYRKFEELGYRVENFSTHFKPIGQFYRLEGADEDDKISIEEIKGFEKFDTLLHNYLYMFSWLRPMRLHYLSAMLNQSKVYSVKVPWSMERLDEVYTEICEHSRKIEKA